MSLSAGANGAAVWFENTYSERAARGVSILVGAAGLSFIAVIGILTAITVFTFKSNHTFIRSHIGAYFTSLLFAELLQAIGSLMSARWIANHAVSVGSFCSTQAALKGAGSVSTALWSTIIAFHTFILIFLQVRIPQWVCYVTLISVWLIVGAVVLLGPAVFQTAEKGPIWGVSGYWCWITGAYQLEQFVLEYLFMFMAATVSLVLYPLIFLRLRGNIEGTGRRIVFCRAAIPWHRVPNMGEAQSQGERVGWKLLLYPICYVVLVLPIAACRWSETYGTPVPFEVTIFADAVFLLSGVVNAILYGTTRRVAPIKNIIPSLSSFGTNRSSVLSAYRNSNRDSSTQPLRPHSHTPTPTHHSGFAHLQSPPRRFTHDPSADALSEKRALIRSATHSTGPVTLVGESRFGCGV